MTTIGQLPIAPAVGDVDLLPISHDGVTYAATVAQVVSGLQPAIDIDTGSLLGRVSIGSGGPENVDVGIGLALTNGTLLANGTDHSNFPVRSIISLSDEVVVNSTLGPGLLPISALRQLFSGGERISIDPSGIINVTTSGLVGAPGPQGPVGPQGPAGIQGPVGASGSALVGPVVSTFANQAAATDYVAIWQNGALAWIPYLQLIGGQTINELPAANAASDNDQLLVSQGNSDLSVQNFFSVWNYIKAKISQTYLNVIELTENTVLDQFLHNRSILVASKPFTLTANLTSMVSGFQCKIINLSSGPIEMGSGIFSGSGIINLLPNSEADLLGMTYSGGTVVWWSGVLADHPHLVLSTIIAPPQNIEFSVSGSVFYDVIESLDYSIDSGATWHEVLSPTITTSSFSFVMPGLGVGTYTIQVRDHNNNSVLGVSNSFVVVDEFISISAINTNVFLNNPISFSGRLAPVGAKVEVGVSASQSTPPQTWAEAIVDNEAWFFSYTPNTAGSFYVWARLSGITEISATPLLFVIKDTSVSIIVPSTGVKGQEFSVSGQVIPTSDVVNMQISSSNKIMPTNDWLQATNNAGSLSAALLPLVSGPCYVWAQDEITSEVVVSSAIMVTDSGVVSYVFNNPGGQYDAGKDTIWLSGSISPASSDSIAITISTSNNIVPAGPWSVDIFVAPTSSWVSSFLAPELPGNYYIWLKTVDNKNFAVSGFSVLVV